MALIVANVGEILLVKWALKDTSISEDLVLKLFSNNYTPIATSVAGSFTECSFPGYAAISLLRSDWSDPVTNAGGKAQTVQASKTFTATGDGTAYGYYVVSSISGTLMWAERFGSVANPTDGDTITITPKMTGNSEN